MARFVFGSDNSTMEFGTMLLWNMTRSDSAVRSAVGVPCGDAHVGACWRLRRGFLSDFLGCSLVTVC